MGSEARVGPYRILRLINRGGQGSVYLGYDGRLERRVAIKIYRLPTTRSERRRLLHEARLVAGIQSPKVVQIHDVIEAPEHLAMVMEYVPGCDLEELLRTVRLSLAAVLSIGADIAGALAVARQQHIVHGDLKAGNVLITDTGRAKLTDFGIARQYSGQARGVLITGSVTAISPEQYLGQPLDVRSDLFALGCLLYRMLVAEQAFCRDGSLDSRLLLQGEPPPLPQVLPDGTIVPDELVALVAELLQKNPDHRPRNTQRVRQVMRSAARDIPLAAASSLLQEARPCFRRESAEDIPLRLPKELGREARSRMVSEPRGAIRSRVAQLRRPRQAAALLAFVALLGITLFALRQDGETRLHIDGPVLLATGGIGLPPEVSASWLVEQVKHAVSEQLGPVRVTGPVGATPITTLYAGKEGVDQQVEPEERLQIGLRCADTLCVLALSREWAGEFNHRQAILFPDMPLSQWRAIVQGTALALYQ